MVAAVKAGAGIECGSDHSDYAYRVKIPLGVRDSLATDLA
jgi:hypothetical protein